MDRKNALMEKSIKETSKIMCMMAMENLLYRPVMNMKDRSRKDKLSREYTKSLLVANGLNSSVKMANSGTQLQSENILTRTD